MLCLTLTPNSTLSMQNQTCITFPDLDAKELWYVQKGDKKRGEKHKEKHIFLLALREFRPL